MPGNGTTNHTIHLTTLLPNAAAITAHAALLAPILSSGKTVDQLATEVHLPINLQNWFKENMLGRPQDTATIERRLIEARNGAWG